MQNFAYFLPAFCRLADYPLRCAAHRTTLLSRLFVIRSFAQRLKRARYVHISNGLGVSRLHLCYTPHDSWG